MKGKLTVETLHAVSRRLVNRVVTRNLVVRSGYLALIKLLANDGASQYYINRMQFGTGGAAPAAGNTTLSMPITPIKTIATYTYPEVGNLYRVILETYLLSLEGNGFAIAEAGLLAVNSDLIARAVFTPTAKTSSYILHFTWEIRS